MTDKPVELKRSISLPLLTLYGLGTILGAGIYVLIGEVVAVAGMRAPIAFVVAALLAVFTAFSYAELSARFPRSAGEAVYVEEAFHHRRLSLLMGLMVVLIGIVSSAVLANGFVGYFQAFLSTLGKDAELMLPAWLIIVPMVVVLGLIAAWGITESVWAATLITIMEVAGLLLVIWVARDSFSTLPQQLPQIWPDNGDGVWFGILMGAFLAFYAFVGFEDMVNVAEEVKQPRKTLPRAILLALLLATVLYMLVALVSVLALPLGELAGSAAPLARVYERVTGESPVVIVLISMVAVINGALIQIIMGARVLYGLSWQGWLPEILGRIHPQRRTPLYATALVTAIILVLALWLPLLTLAKVTSLLTLLVFAAVNLSLWRVKRHDRRPPGILVFPLWVPIAGFMVSVVFTVFQLGVMFERL